jgi:hypothetical protein
MIAKGACGDDHRHVARPSSPSVKFTALPAPTITKIANT